MIIFRPLKTNYISQGFGENKACISRTGKVITKKETCPFDYEDFYKSMGMKGHNGIDLMAWQGEPIYHPADFNGWTHLETDFMGGLGVDIVSNEPILVCDKCQELHYVKVRLWHNSDLVGFERRQVKTGDLVAFAGNTGASSGTHSHFALKWCNKSGSAIHTDNGYEGAFDQTPYFENKFILDVLKKDYELNIADEIKKGLTSLRVQILKWKKS